MAAFGWLARESAFPRAPELGEADIVNGAAGAEDVAGGSSKNRSGQSWISSQRQRRIRSRSSRQRQRQRSRSSRSRLELRVSGRRSSDEKI